MSSLQPLRGMRDLLPAEHLIYSHIVETAKEIANGYGFDEIATPLMELKEVFHRSLGDTSDVVSKEMYQIADRGGEDMVLRPEGTAAIARAVISNGLTQSLPLKFFYAGPMFRYERPQKGRFRQFHQLGVELLGVSDPLGDVEVISLAHQLLKKLKVDSRVTLEINTLGDTESRSVYRKAFVAYLQDYRAHLSLESQARLDRNPLRILDTKDAGDKEILKGAPLLSQSLNTFSQEIFAKVQEGLTFLNIPFILNSHLVRGLDYYSHVAFEFTTNDLGSQSAVLAGGRYDGLIETMGGPRIPGVGWSAGTDRLMMMIGSESLPLLQNPIVIIADEKWEFLALSIAQTLRNAGYRVEMLYGKGGLSKRLKKADKMNADFALLLTQEVGEEKIAEGQMIVKNLASGHQSCVPYEILENIKHIDGFPLPKNKGVS